MQFGLEKHWVCNIRLGKVELEGFKTQQGDVIEAVKKVSTYKYLGVLQSRQIQCTKIKMQLTTALTSRLQKILKTRLNGQKPYEGSQYVCNYSTNLLVWHYIVLCCQTSSV
jgi:hypothetical protein